MFTLHYIIMFSILIILSAVFAYLVFILKKGYGKALIKRGKSYFPHSTYYLALFSPKYLIHRLWQARYITYPFLIWGGTYLYFIMTPAGVSLNYMLTTAILVCTVVILALIIWYLVWIDWICNLFSRIFSDKKAS